MERRDVGRIEAFSSLEEPLLNALSIATTAVFLGLVAYFAPGGDIKWWGIAAFIAIWLPLAHFGYGFYDQLTVDKR